jgi:dihydroorotate dehydrogenase electron transfer subunit
MRQEDMRVIAQREIADHVFERVLSGELAGGVCEPGQFVHIRVGGGSGAVAPLLRRPISICSVDPSKNEMTLIYRRGGLGTDRMAAAAPGDTLDVLGPLGHGFPVASAAAGDRALIVGGGVGVPPLFGLARQLVAKGVVVTHVFGFRSAKDVFYEEAFAGLGRTVVMTEDGSAGERGLVTDKIGSMACDVAYACGPLPMLKAVAQMLDDRPLYLSMEQRMGCGIGACLACVVPTADRTDAKGYRRVCCDGPVFKSGEVELC